ncbi:MAG: arsenite methyltransferase [Methanomassiliicoccales archaeon]
MRDREKAVEERYARLAREGEARECSEAGMIELYSPEELSSVPEEVTSSGCACGNPLSHVEVEPGATILDLGSGAGMDCFLASRRVGQEGKVIGVDATQEMLDKARKAAQKLGISNVEFRKGDLHSLPAEDGSVDLVTSNCVINLVRDKSRVFQEAFRVLRPGGKLVVSDRVLLGSLPEGAGDHLDLWSACVSGALQEGEYLSLIERAGFDRVEVIYRRSFDEGQARSLAEGLKKEVESQGKELDLETAVRSYMAVASDIVTARRP